MGRRSHVEERGDGVRELGGQRHFHEDQRLIGELRVEEAETAPVGGLEPIAQIVPVADLVHRLVADDLFQDVGRCRPIDVPQHEEALG